MRMGKRRASLALLALVLAAPAAAADDKDSPAVTAPAANAPSVDEAIAAIEARFDPGSAERCNALIQEMLDRHDRNEPAAALTAGRRALEASRAAYGARSAEAAAMLDTLTGLLYSSGPSARPEQQRLMDEALSIREAVLGPDHLVTIATRRSIVLLRLGADPKQQDPDELPGMEAHLKLAAERLSQVPEPNWAEVAQVWSNLAIVRTRRGDFAGAEAALAEADAVDPVRAKIGSSLTDVSRARIELLRAQGRAAEASAIEKQLRQSAASK